jgi:hypothetical protein
MSLATIARQQGWTENKINDELKGLIARNPDLVEQKAIETFKLEFSKFADPRLNGFLTKISKLANKVIDAQEAGGKLRYNHELIKFCNRALRHPGGPGAAIEEIEAEL